ncbi:putative glycerophosphoryl diester phosphodiesterase [Stipitochalara longipes BDJ]|nr:putative glycerophosphoryl diester phosphodiesterase [Stipitochalara longipes BDJ]
MAENLPLLQEKMEPTNRFFISAKDSPKGSRPQAIAHRGYRAAFPENTMAAFKGAVKVGAHAIETDIHLTKDGVVVLSHDPTLERCFGKKDKIIDLEWREIEPLRTIQQPGEPMPRLQDLLEYLSEPEVEDIWVLLDIKTDNNADDVMRLIATTLNKGRSSRPWSERILLGFWIPYYLPLCTKYLPDYRTAHIGFSIPYARQFLKEPGVNFNMLQKSMVGPLGNKFLQDLKAAGRSIFLWTVNDEDRMKWCVMKEVDGVITDDPLKFLEISRNYNGEQCRLPASQYGTAIWINILATLFGFMYRFRKSRGSQRSEAIPHS